MENLLKHVGNCDTIEGAVQILESQIEISNEIKNALFFTVERHKGQMRRSGVPYAIHPILTATLVAYYGGDETMVIAALLHDIVEDTECLTEDIVKLFGEEVAELVEIGRAHV